MSPQGVTPQRVSVFGHYGVLRDYFKYYHGSRTHLGLEKDCPSPRPVKPPELGLICTESMVGGLHHRYYRQAA